MLEKADDLKGILHATDAKQHYSLKRYAPSADLASFVEQYWIVRWDMAEAQTFQVEVLPYPCVNAAITSEAAEITGVYTGKFNYTLRGNGTVLGIKFRPGGFYPLFKKSVDRLTNQTIPMSDIWSTTRIKKIAASLSADPAPTDEGLVIEIEKLLRSKKPQPDPTVEAVVEIIQQATSNPEIRQVKDVSELFQTSERTLQYAFQKYVGVGLKWIISRYRLQDIAQAIDNGETDWAKLANTYGFTDQSHFIRDFKKILGETPAQYSQRPK